MPLTSELNLRSAALVALGSNLGESRSILAEAFGRLNAFSTRPLLASSLWESAPVDCPPGSPPFINAAAALFPFPTETPLSLLHKLQTLEREFGRTPKRVQNEPRPLDLDLICFGEVFCNTAELALPHPRAHLRAFVLAPLDELAPDLVLPGQNRTIHELLAHVRFGQDVQRIASSDPQL